jgi:hypothetical protein
MIAQPSTDPQQQSMSNMMQIMMPLMFAFITLTLPSGLGIYFVVSGVASIVIQYFIFGWGNLFTRAPAKETVAPKAAKQDSGKTPSGSVVPYRGPQKPKVAGGLGQAARDLLGRFGFGGGPEGGADTSAKGKASGESDQRSSGPEGSKYGKSGSKGKDG